PPLFANQLGLLPITLSHCCCVTSNFPIQNAREIVTSCCASCDSRSGSSSGEPITKLPEGISTKTMRVVGSVHVAPLPEETALQPPSASPRIAPTTRLMRFEMGYFRARPR